MKKSLFLGALCATAPLALLLPGCSGGSSGLGSTSATATPIPTASQISNLILGNG